MMYKNLAISIAILFSLYVVRYVFSVIKVKKVNRKISTHDYLLIFSFKVYFVNLFIWIMYFACAGFLNKGRSGEWFYSLLFVVPIYIVFSGIATYLKIYKIHKTEESSIFFKKMQAVFEIIFTIVTVSLLLATLSGMSSKQIQTIMLLIILGMYTPVLPILGALKYYNA